MERTDILELMATPQLYGMRASYDEVMATGIKRRHEPPHIVGDLLSAEIAEKQARSIKYQLTIAKLPLAKDIDNFDFTGSSSNIRVIRIRHPPAWATVFPYDHAAIGFAPANLTGQIEPPGDSRWAA